MTYQIKLPLFLKPKSMFPLMRIGGDGDGGYLVDTRILNCDLLSIGIAGDWRFEKQWLINNPNAKIGTFDGSISGVFFFRKAFQSLFRIHKPSLLFRNIRVFYEYFIFLKKNTNFSKLFIGKKDNFISFNDAINKASLRKPFCVKIDIEGSEYEILDQILENQSDISALLIEFHDPIKNLDKITKFIDKFNLKIANTHVNNCLPRSKNAELDPCIEVSFSSKEVSLEKAEIPHHLEQPNDPKCKDFKVFFTKLNDID